MEVEGLGARCSLSSCRHLDYLPYKCVNCSRPFCEEHHVPKQHNCTSKHIKHVPTCPLCNAAVPAKAEQSLDEAMAIHIDDGCPKRSRNNPLCSLPSCNVRDPAATPCVACKKIFCVSHCVEITHQCNVPLPSTSKLQAFRIQNTDVKTKTKTKTNASFFKIGPSSSSTVSTNFLNLKSNPIKDSLISKSIEEQEIIDLSVYFNIQTSLIKPRYMTFTTRNSAGRIIDMIHKHVAELPKLQQKQQRYSLYAIRSDMSRVNLLPYVTPLRDLGDIILDGDSLILQLGSEGIDRSVLDTVGKSIIANNKIGTGFSRGGVKGKKIPRAPERRNTKCLMA